MVERGGEPLEKTTEEIQ
jgi:hypothetical protein